MKKDYSPWWCLVVVVVVLIGGIVLAEYNRRLMFEACVKGGYSPNECKEMVR